MGDDVDLAPRLRVLDEAPGNIVYLYALLAKLRGALDAGDKRDDHDSGYGDEGDHDARWLRYYVRHGRVRGDYGDCREPSAASLDPLRLAVSVTAIAAEVIIARTPVAYGPAWAVALAPKSTTMAKETAV